MNCPFRLPKNAHLLRFPHPSGALHLGIFEQPGDHNFFRDLLDFEVRLIEFLLMKGWYEKKKPSSLGAGFLSHFGTSGLLRG